MPRISTDNYDTVASWNGSQDLFIVEQPDGTKVATPAMVKQFIEAGDFEATGEVKDGHGNVLADMAKASDVDAEIDAITEVQTISGSGSYGCSYTAYKYGRVVTLRVRNIVNSSLNQQMPLFNLPQGWRPIVDVDVVGKYSYGGFDASGTNAVYFRAEASGGKVWTYSYYAFGSGAVDMTFLVAE